MRFDEYLSGLAPAVLVNSADNGADEIRVRILGWVLHNQVFGIPCVANHRCGLPFLSLLLFSLSLRLRLFFLLLRYHLSKGVVVDYSTTQTTAPFVLEKFLGLRAHVAPLVHHDRRLVGRELQDTWVDFLAGRGAGLDTPGPCDLVQRGHAGVTLHGGEQDHHG